MGDILGYARVSTGDQDVAGQTMRLEEAGAIKVFTDVMSGKSMERPGLAELIAYARKGDTLAVVRLDRLGRSLAELLATVDISSTDGQQAIREAVSDLYEHISKEEDGLFPASLTALDGDEWDASIDAWHDAHPGRHMIAG